MKKATLIVLDGWGKGDGSRSDAIAHSNVPFFRHLMKSYPSSTLLTYGEHVGLPDGQMGNSEVGHMNIGAGRVVYQELARIDKDIRDKHFFKNPLLLSAFRHAIEKKKNIHLLGLVSDGGVHSHIHHLKALCDLGKELAVNQLYIHAFTDGRDTDPRSGLGFISDLENHLKKSVGTIASVCGRYYAMDRDKRWERVKAAYDLLTAGKGDLFNSASEGIQASYAHEVTDEFIRPIKINGTPSIMEGDVVICFNFRTDRCREITTVLTQKDMPEHGMRTLPLHYTTFTRYDESFRNIHVVYEKENLSLPLGEVLANKGKTQLRIAETEKYPHVTFFFNGGREEPFPGEKRIMIPSPKVATYDLQPEMSAKEVTDAVLNVMSEGKTDFICLNFANPDMIGHTGVYSAVQKALETVDTCLQKVVTAGMQAGYSFIVLADHGNADYMINADGTPNTAHSMNPVPCILIDERYQSIQNGKLGDIAPTLLTMMGIPVPAEMTGNVLLGR
ncbi:MAG: 2,3-bisphosphoglycerate-independent phosphoglycerate mutase [Bacteroidia bacterium]|nr:2,3-bisphosphoglycerate-independent phosphoglycerate mutase [Bacteroidia bacterium]